jgi:short-subunit dehydrogenase
MRTPAQIRRMAHTLPEAKLCAEEPRSGSAPLQGRHALVTGASSGLGADLARELARRGASLLLVARREDRLRALERQLADRHGVTVDVAVLDLTARGRS